MNERIVVLTDGLRAIHEGWPFFLAEIDVRIQELTNQLVNANNDETRGQIKALISVKNLPQTLDDERTGLIAALASQEAAASGLPAQADPWSL